MFLLGFISIFLLKWQSSLLGVDWDEPIREYEYGITIAIILFIELLFFGFIGYLLGWLINAGIARYVLGWPSSKVKQVFLHSEIPMELLQEGITLESYKDKKYQVWKEKRKKGMFNYIFKTGVFGWGATMYLLMVILPSLNNKIPLDTSSLLVKAGIWAIGGAVFGSLVWYFSERQYMKFIRVNDSNKPINKDAP